MNGWGGLANARVTIFGDVHRYTQNPEPWILCPTPSTLSPKPYTLHHRPWTLNLRPHTLHHAACRTNTRKLPTRSSRPSTPHARCGVWTLCDPPWVGWWYMN